MATKFSDVKDDESQKWSGISEEALTSGLINDSARLEPFVVIEDNVSIGENTVIGPYTFLRSGTKIGRDSIVGPHCVSEGKQVVIGDQVRIGSHCNFGYGVVIEDLVFVAGHLTGANDDKITWKRMDVFNPEPYKIEFAARIGLQCVIGAGVIVGRESMVGMGSVVTDNTKKRSLYYGNPAKWKRLIPIDEEIDYEKYNLSYMSYNEVVNRYGTIVADYHKDKLLQWIN
jgi:UDP-2-acetamido-3-amino-2,3-dideoxy-glucuronate N-acetyltransferase